MKTIVFATNNNHKLDEIRAIMPSHFKVISLTELGFSDEIPETADTLEGNALIKAQYISKKFNCDCFADDTGLSVAALNGEPGVYSARYAGSDCSSVANVQKLLGKLTEKKDRTAFFKTVIALIIQNREYLFEGIINGQISQSVRGTNGFGYDPVFVPDGHTQTFAELDINLKNNISHRAIAVRKLAAFLAKFKE